MTTAPESAVKSATGQQPDHPVVFFDGVCGLCNHTVNFLIRIDRRRRLRYAPLQGETARAKLSEKEWSDLNTMILLDDRGVHRKSTAAARCLMHIGGAWGIAGMLLWVIPAPLRNAGYTLVARNRYRIWGKHETCRLPRPGEQELFLP